MSAGMETEGLAWLKRGTMVSPEWPPMTGMVVSWGVLGAGDLGDEGLGADDVEGGDTEEALGVEDTLGLKDLGGDGDGGVDGVGDDEDEGLGGDIGDDLDEALDDTGVDVEEIITGHSWLACMVLAWF